MRTRSVVTVIYKGKQYAGEYELAGRSVRVFFESECKAGILKGSDAELLARILLIELISRAELARASDRRNYRGNATSAGKR